MITYWEIESEIAQQERRQGWGTKVVDHLAKDLARAFPDFKGLSPRNLRYMRSFAVAWPAFLPDDTGAGINVDLILQQPAAKLPWFHLCTLLDKVKIQAERHFYAAQAVENGWSRNVLVHQIESGLVRRQGLLYRPAFVSLETALLRDTRIKDWRL